MMLTAQNTSQHIAGVVYNTSQFLCEDDNDDDQHNADNCKHDGDDNGRN